MEIQGFNHITINVKDLEVSLNFYVNVLNMTLVHQGRSDAYLEWGGAWVCLIEKPIYSGASQGYMGVDHVAFSILKKDFQDAVEHLQHEDVPIVRGPVQRGQGWSVNFLDPDGTQLELHTSNLKERMKVWN
ncbi:VOC family protein [Pontibacillus marinus]|uniref:Glutathione transferase n=1 Tax=Pontibacillus marinus BH030004 = DSM 16465 TaxID=1385511 RepID=A0A0A5HMW0_9BACI|nr:VOC family protein [Pontibacillus marinus]KGX84947.1 glutathione transferase [Pontibacillus marinus BH030004 = DSM 16465]